MVKKCYIIDVNNQQSTIRGNIMKNTKNTTKTIASSETKKERTWAPEVIFAALEARVKPEGMSNTYWYKLRKNAGIEITRTKTYTKDEIAEALKNMVKPENMSNTYWHKLRKNAGLLHVELPKAKKETKKTAPKVPAKKPVEKKVETKKTVTEADKKAEALAKRRANYAAKKDHINELRRANRAKKSAEKKAAK